MPVPTWITGTALSAWVIPQCLDSLHNGLCIVSREALPHVQDTAHSPQIEPNKNSQSHGSISGLPGPGTSSDTGFTDIRNYPPGQYAGIVVLRLPANATSPVILALLESFLMQIHAVNEVPGKLAIVERGRIPVRKA